MSRLRGESREISDVKELIGKIFRTKGLASAAVLRNTRGESASPTKPEECEGRCHGSDVTGERWEREAASVSHTIAHNAIEWAPAATPPSGTLKLQAARRIVGWGDGHSDDAGEEIGRGSHSCMGADLKKKIPTLRKPRRVGHPPIEWGTLELDGPPARVASGYRWLLTADPRASS